jgi:GTP-binding protein YchF
MDRIAEIYKPEKVVDSTIEFVDIAGLVKGASKGEGLGNQFLAKIREVDAIVHVVRCFEDANVTHVHETIEPQRDIEIVETELILKDLETTERRLADVDRKAKSGDKKAKSEHDFLLRIKSHLAGGRLAHYFVPHHDDELEFLKEAHFLTSKPVMYVCNVHEKDIGRDTSLVVEVKKIAEKEGAEVVVISAEIEAEIAQLSPEDRSAYLNDMGLAESGLQRMIRAGYHLLQLLTFFTVNPKELHAWTVRKGTIAMKAAGVIHSDFERGFIRAEVIRFDDLNNLGSEHAIKEKGLLHVQGRDYQLQDGEIVYIRFNV